MKASLVKMDYKKMGLELSESIKRAVYVNLSSLLIPILRSAAGDDFTVLLYISLILFLFTYVQFSLFENLLFAMLVRQAVNMTIGPYQLLTVFNLSLFFMLFQCAGKWIPQKFSTQIISTTQYIYASAVYNVLLQYINHQLIVTMILCSLVAIFKQMHINNSQFLVMFTMSATQSVQSLVLSSIPAVFLVPSSFTVLYMLQAVVKVFMIGETVLDYIEYTTASFIQTTLGNLLSADIVLYIGLIMSSLLSSLKLNKAVQVSKTLCLLTATSLGMAAVNNAFKADPIFCMVVLAFTLSIIR